MSTKFVVAALGLLTFAALVSGSQTVLQTRDRHDETHSRTEQVRPKSPDPLSPDALSSTPLEQFRAMSPAERKAAIAALPPRERMEVEAAINRLASLPEAERRQLLTRYERFEHLSPKRQAEVRFGISQFRALPTARRRAVKQEWDVLKSLPRKQREAYVASRDFKRKLSPAERRIIRSEALVLPD